MAVICGNVLTCANAPLGNCWLTPPTRHAPPRPALVIMSLVLVSNVKLRASKPIPIKSHYRPVACLLARQLRTGFPAIQLPSHRPTERTNGGHLLVALMTADWRCAWSTGAAGARRNKQISRRHLRVHCSESLLGSISRRRFYPIKLPTAQKTRDKSLSIGAAETDDAAGHGNGRQRDAYLADWKVME